MKKCSIMIIDDDEVDRYLLKRVIKKLDIDVEIFESENGKEALNFLSDFEINSRTYPDDFPPTLIFLDINMPIMGGLEFLEAFKKMRSGSNNYNSAVFIMFTSSESDEDKRKIDSYDFVKDYIVKGEMSPEILKNAIEMCNH